MGKRPVDVQIAALPTGLQTFGMQRKLLRACSLSFLILILQGTPSFVPTFRRASPSLLARGFFDKLGFDNFGNMAMEEGDQWRALTKIKVREDPSFKAKQFEDKVIEAGEIFIVAEEFVSQEGNVRSGYRRYLRLAGSKGWVFDLGIAGDWYGKPIAEQVFEDEDGSNPVGDFGDSVKNMFK
mmetsp:Transcript_52303/g.93797  ORF Transcript_52303/g.93797 Transcript_52303/m.93797 type:complete len:182 (+) Transcript_52303:40-585(+)